MPTTVARLDVIASVNQHNVKKLSPREAYFARLTEQTRKNRAEWKVQRLAIHLREQHRHLEKRRVEFEERPCVACNEQYAIPKKWAHRDYCVSCGVDASFAQMDCASQVAKAIRLGRLMRPDAFRCTDCDAWADRYDHRDYSKPLQVEPVCAGCNARRPPAFRQQGRAAWPSKVP